MAVLKHFFYPSEEFHSSSLTLLDNNNHYSYITKIGVQIPNHTTPFHRIRQKESAQEVLQTTNGDFCLTINNKPQWFVLNGPLSIEFDDINTTKANIVFKEPIPWGTTVDVMLNGIEE